MCGIAGIVSQKNLQPPEAAVRKMTSSLEHRGPDATGIYISENISLGHCRLSIIDLSDNANQPMFDFTKRFSIVFNGEIYNFREIKEKLKKNYPFQTNSDTEVILAAFSRYGSQCLELFNGMFAFAIWDHLKNELFVARDRLGVKPLYYSVTPQREFIFASEIRALLNSGKIPRKINFSGLYNYLLYQSVYAPQTIVEGVFQLPAGSFGIFSEGKLEIKNYWKIENNLLNEPNANFNSATEVKKKVKQLLLKSVERRMISDVRLGAFLSGGIDSSAIVALMSEVSEAPVETFSVTFGEKEFDESLYSTIVARKFRTRHSEIRLTARNFLEELPQALQSVDSPTGDGINTFVVSKATRKAGIKVALSGLGGDELFAGYPNFLRWFHLQKNHFFHYTPDFLRRAAASVLQRSKNSKYQRLGNLAITNKPSIFNVYPLFRQVFSEQMADAFLLNGNRQNSLYEMLKKKEPQIKTFPVLSQFSIAELLGYTQNVLLKDTDQFSMASALEVREPFFDYELVEYVLQIPDSIKYPKYPKRLLVESISPLLPDEIVHRKKMGFVLPWEKWMRNELKEFCETRLNKLKEFNLLNSSPILQRWKDFQNGRKNILWSQFWHLVVLTDWLERNKF
jgi:asparagine synthase (glutamine-hydrolysing)